MKTIRNHQEDGITLAATLGIMTVIAIGVGVSYAFTGQNARFADRGQDLTSVRAAAEGALEYAYGMWKGKSLQLGRPLTTSECAALGTPPSYAGTTYSQTLSVTPADFYGAPTSTPTSAVVDVVGFPGWKGRTYNYLARVGLTGTSTMGKAPATFQVKRAFQYITVQLFQAMYFYESDFEIYRPAPMIVGGLTHTNRVGMVSNDLTNNLPLTFLSPVSHVLGMSNAEPYKSTTWSGYVSGANQNPTYSSTTTQTPRLEPLGSEPFGVLDTPPTGPYAPSGQLVGPDGDSDGNPNNDSFHELIEPPVTGQTDPAPIATRRLYNKAGIIVTINGTTKTVTTQNGTTLTSAQQTTIQNAITNSTIYDYREQSNVRVNNLNIGNIRTTLDAATGFNGVLYIHDITPTTSSTPKNAIRLQNGGTLPVNGLTVASQNGVYIHGDYNTGSTISNSQTSVPSNASGNPNNTDSPTVSGYTRKPSAVIGDAIMLLSNAWNDANASSALSNRIANHTTYNTAILSGTLPSGYKHTSTSAEYGYSGGANNYPRFLEDWNAKDCTYFGSMVQLFTSKTFIGKWDTGSIYRPPNRRWNYDPNFDNNPPPGSVDAVLITRGRWARY